MNRVSKALREYADSIDYIQDEFGVIPTVLRGQSCLYEKTTFDLSEANKQKLWDKIDADNYGFIGIMPNQWRPEIHIKAVIKDVPVYIFNYQAYGFNNYDGGFISEYGDIRHEFMKFNAPEFIIEKLDNLYKECLQNSEKEKLSQKKERLQKKLKEIEEKEKLYSS